MNILFLTIGRMPSIEAHSLYPDLLRKLRDEGHQVYIVSQREKRTGLATELIEENRAQMLYVRVGNITKCNLIEKGISTIRLEGQFKRAIRDYFGHVHFDLVLYSTPPITLAGIISYIKKRDGARTYLLLKDIFPQNSVDLGLLSKHGVKGLIYRFFRRKERQLYALSDKIGCMSPANCTYLMQNNPEVSTDKVEVFPNCIEPEDMRLTAEEKLAVRRQYGLPTDKRIFMYGGNLGRPQDVPFIIQCLRGAADLNDVYFVLAGSGTDRHYLDDYIEREQPAHVKMLGLLPKDEYDRMVACCDVGLIFLDHRFTIPNFPSRLLVYMQAGLPVLACTDVHTDVGQVITEGGFGLWCESTNVQAFREKVCEMAREQSLDRMAEAAYAYLNAHYSVNSLYERLLME